MLELSLFAKFNIEVRVLHNFFNPFITDDENLPENVFSLHLETKLQMTNARKQKYL